MAWIKGLINPFSEMNYKNTSTSQQTFVGKRVVAKTCWRRLEDVFKTSRKTSWRRLGRRKIVTLKTSWRCLEDMSWRRLKTSRRQTKFLLVISVSKKSKCLSNKSLFHKLYLRKLRGIQNPKANPIISIFVLFWNIFKWNIVYIQYNIYN